MWVGPGLRPSATTTSAAACDRLPGGHHLLEDDVEVARLAQLLLDPVGGDRLGRLQGVVERTSAVEWSP